MLHFNRGLAFMQYWYQRRQILMQQRIGTLIYYSLHFMFRSIFCLFVTYSERIGAY
jgi:hypothetical protein